MNGRTLRIPRRIPCIDGGGEVEIVLRAEELPCNSEKAPRSANWRVDRILEPARVSAAREVRMRLDRPNGGSRDEVIGPRCLSTHEREERASAPRPFDVHIAVFVEAGDLVTTSEGLAVESKRAEGETVRRPFAARIAS